MKTKNLALNGLALSLVFALSLGENQAWAGQRNRDYRETCESSAPHSDAQNLSCSNAKVSLINKDGDAAKAILFTVAAVATTALGAVSFFTGGINESVCNTINLATTGAGLAIDIDTGIRNHEVMSSLEKAGIGLLTGLGGAKLGLENIPGIGKKIEDLDKGAGKKHFAGCISATASLGVQALTAGKNLKADQAGFDSAYSAAKNYVDHRPTQYNPGFKAPDATIGAGESGNSGKSQNRTASSDGLCQSDPNYSACMKNAVPEVAAILNSPALMAPINNALKGKSVDDFLKGYDSDKTSPQAYVAQTLGIPTEAMDKFSHSLEAVAKTSGATDHYTPMGYASSGPKPASVGSGDLDFSKMMNDMLKQLNPDGTPNTSKDPAALVFRQLDLLSPEKIEASKDISLFARIGYRYQKKASEVERLNWSSQSNAGNPVGTDRLPSSN